MGEIYYIYWYIIKNLLKDYKIYQIVIKLSKVPKISRHFPFQDPAKFTQILILGMKTYHLATLEAVEIEELRGRSLNRC
jgi:hypothetical protein